MTRLLFGWAYLSMELKILKLLKVTHITLINQLSSKIALSWYISINRAITYGLLQILIMSITYIYIHAYSVSGEVVSIQHDVEVNTAKLYSFFTIIYARLAKYWYLRLFHFCFSTRHLRCSPWSESIKSCICQRHMPHLKSNKAIE